MNNKRIFYTGGLLLLTAAVVFFLNRSGDNSFDKEGQPLVPDIITEDYDEIVIKTAKYQMKLKLDDSRLWVASGAEKVFLADATKIYNLFNDLSNIKYSRLVATGKDKFADFGLAESDKLPEAAVVISFYRQLTVAKTLFFGNLRITKSGPKSGQYFRQTGDDNIYLISKALLIPSAGQDWWSYVLLSLSEDELATVSLKKADLMFDFSKEDTTAGSNWRLTAKPDKKLAHDILAELFNFVNPLKVQSIKKSVTLKEHGKFFELGYQTSSGDEILLKVYHNSGFYPEVDEKDYIIQFQPGELSSTSNLKNKQSYYSDNLFIVSGAKVENIKFSGYER